MDLKNKDSSFKGGSFSKEKLSIDTLSLCHEFRVDPKTCDKPWYYESYLTQTAPRDMEDGLGVTYLYIDTDNETGERRVMGFFTLRFSSLIKDMGERRKYGYPALEISELAVSEQYLGTGVGTDMVMDAINMASELNEYASIKYVVLCADPNAEGFYTRSTLNFKKLDVDFGDDIPREYGNIDCIPLYLKLR